MGPGLGIMGYRKSSIPPMTCTRVSINSKEEGKCQESIQLVPHLTQNTLWESDKRTRKRHIQF